MTFSVSGFKVATREQLLKLEASIQNSFGDDAEKSVSINQVSKGVLRLQVGPTTPVDTGWIVMAFKEVFGADTVAEVLADASRLRRSLATASYTYVLSKVLDGTPASFADSKRMTTLLLGASSSGYFPELEAAINPSDASFKSSTSSDSLSASVEQVVSAEDKLPTIPSTQSIAASLSSSLGVTVAVGPVGVGEQKPVDDDDDDEAGSNVGAIVGGVFGGLVFIVVAGLVVFRVVTKLSAQNLNMKNTHKNTIAV